MIECLTPLLLCLQSGIDITKLISQKKKAEAKRLRKEKKEARKAKKDAKKNAQEWVRRRSDTEEREIIPVCLYVSNEIH